jgi:hypothetical protein
MRGTRGSWLAFVFIPLLLVGIAASLWLIVRGAWGLIFPGSDQARTRGTPKDGTKRGMISS